MFRLLFLLIVVFSVIEIAIFVWLGNVTSIWFVLIGIILTGVIGAFLAKVARNQHTEPSPSRNGATPYAKG